MIWSYIFYKNSIKCLSLKYPALLIKLYLSWFLLYTQTHKRETDFLSYYSGYLAMYILWLWLNRILFVFILSSFHWIVHRPHSQRLLLFSFLFLFLWNFMPLLESNRRENKGEVQQRLSVLSKRDQIPFISIVLQWSQKCQRHRFQNTDKDN